MKTDSTRADRDWTDTLPEPVRRRDLREPGAAPPYPKVPFWQWGGACTVDILLHLAIALVVALRVDLPFAVTAITVYTVVSFGHRCLLQWWWGGTIGRVLFGLRCVVTATGAKATFGGLLKFWLLAGYILVLTVVIPVLAAIP